MHRSSFSALVIVALSTGLLGACTPSSSADSSSPRASTAVAPMVVAPAPAMSARVYTRPPLTELASRLTRLQYEVTQNAATEPPFQNAYWNNHEAGIYVDIATGEPLFSSRDKFESGTGWPSFTRAIDDGHVVSHTDTTHGMVRTEVVSKAGGSHLGHLFDDGPAPSGIRYCINSASLRFVSADRLAAEGYGAYAAMFGVAAAAPTPPAATSNACAVPPPGTRPACHSTLDVAIFARAGGDDRLASLGGVLEVVRGFEGSDAAVEVTFDPTKVTYAELVDAWTKGRERQSRVYARDDAQRQVAAAKALSVADAVPFRRE